MPSSRRVALYFGMLILALSSSLATLALRPVLAQMEGPGILRVAVQCVPINTNAPWQATLGFAGTHVVNVLRDGTIQGAINGAGSACFEVFYQL